MKAFSNDNIKDKLCGGCDCNGFTADLTYAFTGPSTLVITDASVYGSGDSRKIVKITVVDDFGNKVVSSMAANDGDNAITISLATLDLSYGFSILATVVTTNGCISDGSAHAVGVNTNSGSLGYWDKDNNALTIGVTDES